MTRSTCGTSFPRFLAGTQTKCPKYAGRTSPGAAPVEEREAEVDYQVAAAVETGAPNWHRAINRSTKECGWKDGNRGGPAERKQIPRKEPRKTDLTLTCLLMEGSSPSSAIVMVIRRQSALKPATVIALRSRACVPSGFVIHRVLRNEDKETSDAL